MRSLLLKSFLPAAVTICSAASLCAQCSLGSSMVGPIAGVDGVVRAIVNWDPDGAGPASPLAVVAGDFQQAAGQPAARVATVDPVTGRWSALGAGLSSSCRALAVGPGNMLVAATQTGVFEWDGAVWSALGAASPAGAYAIAVRPNGQVIVGGTFGARVWGGTAWGTLSLGGTIYSLLCMPNGDIVFGGQFGSAGSVPAANIVRWNGGTWSPFGSGSPGTVTALALDQNGDLLAGGAWAAPGINWDVGRWNGSTWTTLGSFWGQVTAIAVDASGTLCAGGAWSGGGQFEPPRRQSGSSWVNLCGYDYDGFVYAMHPLPSGNGVLVGGSFTLAGNEVVNRVFQWQGSSSGLRSPSFQGQMRAVAGCADGRVVVADVAAASCTVWQGMGSSWDALGAPFPSPVRDLVELPDGDLLAVGSTPNVARWDGVAWSAATSGLVGTATRLVQREDGQLLVGGSDGVHAWTGSAWTAFGPATSDVLDLAIVPDGRMALLRSIGGQVRVETWDPTTQQTTTLPAIANTIHDLEMDADGSVWLGCDSIGWPIAGLFRWDGASWQSFPTDGPVDALRRLPGGRLAHTDFANWQGPQPNAYCYVRRVVAPSVAEFRLISPRSRFFSLGVQASGLPIVAGDVPAGPIQLTTTCGATLTSTPSGCTGPGSTALQTANLPFVDGEWHAFGTGLQQPAIVATVTAFSTAMQPLSALTPLAGPGCQVNVATDDFVDFQVSLDGTAHRWFRIPLQVAALAGLEFHQQMLVMELDAAGSFVGATATNSLSMTIGWF
ncbi:MAG: hypothetical protein R3F29_02940 [Planctomycetota bacterium]